MAVEVLAVGDLTPSRPDPDSLFDRVRDRRIAFLSYSSILPMGYWAEVNRPGCAPMRAHTHYEQVEHDQPGIHFVPAVLADYQRVVGHAASPGFREIQGLHPNWVPDFDSSYNFPADSRRTVVARLLLGVDGGVRASLLPTYVDRRSVPEILAPDDPRFDEVCGYLADVTRVAGLDTELVVDGDELVVAGVE